MLAASCESTLMRTKRCHSCRFGEAAGRSRRLRKRVVLVCPGRGTYTKTELGFFSRPAPAEIAGEIKAMVAYADQVRAARGDATLSELDGAAQFSSRHVAGENAGFGDDFNALDPPRAAPRILILGHSLSSFGARVGRVGFLIGRCVAQMC